MPVDSSTGDDVDRPTHWYPGISWTDWLMLQWIRTLPQATQRSEHLLDGLQTRHLYKRVATFGRGSNHDNLIRRLEELNYYSGSFLLLC